MWKIRAAKIDWLAFYKQSIFPFCRKMSTCSEYSFLNVNIFRFLYFSMGWDIWRLLATLIFFHHFFRQSVDRQRNSWLIQQPNPSQFIELPAVTFQPERSKSQTTNNWHGAQKHSWRGSDNLAPKQAQQFNNRGLIWGNDKDTIVL